MKMMAEKEEKRERIKVSNDCIECTYVLSNCSLSTMMILLEALAVSTMQSVKNSFVVTGKSR